MAHPRPTSPDAPAPPDTATPDARELDRLRARMRELEALLDTTAELVCATGPDGRITYVNRAWHDALGYSLAEAAAMRPVDFVAPEHQARYVEAARGLLAGEAVLDFEAVLLARDGRRITCRGHGLPVLVATPEGARCIGTRASYLDVTALRTSQARFRAVFDSAAVGISVVDDAGTVLQANAALETFLGYGPGELVGVYAPELSPPEDASVTRGPVAELRAGIRANVTVEKRFVRRDGVVRWAALTLSRLPLGDGGWGTLGLISDTTDRRVLESRLAALAEHDELTGLLNRRGFARMAAQELKAASRTRRHDALLYVDLDDLKPINDTFGHAAGDAALRATAEIVRATMRDADFGARLGGDEFAVYAVGLRAGEGQILASRLRANLAAHNAAAVGCPYRIGFSVGVAELEHGDSLDTLLARGDAALYAQKAGRGA